MARVLIVNSIPGEADRYRERLEEWFPELTVETATHPDAATNADKADILMTFGPQTTADLFERAQNLKWVQSLGVGLDGITDRPALTPRAIVTSTRGMHGPPVAEATIALMLSLIRKLPTLARQQDRHEWRRYQVGLLHNKTAGIVGVGVIGEALAIRLKAFGMRVVGITGTPRNLPGFDEMRQRDPLAEAVRDLDFVILLLPLTEESRGMVDASVFAAMKPSAFLINVARGGVVDEAAMLAALRDGTFAGAGLDVFSTEPLPADSPLWDENKIVINPHNAGLCDVYADIALEIIRPNMEAFLAGRYDDMINIVRRGQL